jgi:steroid delta-isomerase-like uncharacterized protein
MGESTAPAQTRNGDPGVSREKHESSTAELSSPVAVVEAYAAAKSAGDVEAALAVCADDAVFVTIPFQAVARGVAEARAQFTNFVRAFPDYNVEVDVLEAVGDMVFSSGTIRATMRSSLAGIEPTGRQYALPFACHWKVRDGLIVHEAFFYDFNQMCEQLGLDVGEAASRFATWRSRSMGRHEEGRSIA